MLCLPELYPGLFAASAKCRRNPRPANGERSQHAHVFESDDRHASRHSLRDLRRLSSRVCGYLCAYRQSAVGPGGGGGEVSRGQRSALRTDQSTTIQLLPLLSSASIALRTFSSSWRSGWTLRLFPVRPTCVS